MKRSIARWMIGLCIMALLLVLGSIVWKAQSAANPRVEEAQRIITATGVKGGLIVHLGCGDGRLTVALHVNDSYIVHGLDRDPKNVEKARTYIHSLGLYGKVSVDTLRGEQLPYIDNFVNLLVVEDMNGISMNEVMRVLCPKGVAYIRQGSKWLKRIKPWPKEIDEWTHYLHDATNNAVSHDTVIGPPRHLQWVGNPRWARHHDHMASMSALVSANGRIFYIMDEGSRASILLPSKWYLVARDAFNGTILWKRKISSWWTQLWPLKSGPAQLPRRLIAIGDRVYVTLGLNEPLSALDAATGETIRTYDATKATREVIYSDGILFVLVDPSAERLKQFASVEDVRKWQREWMWNMPKRVVMALEADTGKVLWRRGTSVAPLTLAADNRHVYFHDGERVICLDRNTGKQVWASEPLPRWSTIRSYFAPTLVVYRDVVLFAGGEGMIPHRGGRDTITALSADTGKVLWRGEHPPCGYQSPEDVLVAGGLVWAGETTSGGYSGIFTGWEPRTGEIKSQFAPDVKSYWFHHRCYRAKATDRYILTSRTGIEFIDFRKQHWMIHHWVRGGCLYGIMPCNGLIYTPPHDCACYIEAKLFGFNALAPASPTRQVPRNIPDEQRLERGPAYGDPVPPLPTSEGDWVTYRHDMARSGSTKVSVPTNLKRAWSAKLGGKLTAPVVAGGMVFVASVDTHTLYALSARTGNVQWRYIAGGRIDSPPTIYQGRVLFGCADGWVYCLRAVDGQLIWRFRAAPIDRRLMAFEQIESVWPVHGSVLVLNGVVYCVAGRSMFLDGGLRFLRLDVRTGRKLSERILDERDPKTGKNLQVYVSGLNMTVALPDILSSDGKNIYMRSMPFDMQGVRKRIAYVDVTQQRGDDVHLFAATGFLDDTWFHRSYWIYGRSMASGAGGYYLAGKFAPAGRILAFDSKSVYGYGRKPQYYRWTTPLEYHLFATSTQIPKFDKSMVKVRGRSCILVAKSKSLNPANKPLTVMAWIRARRGDGVIIARGGPVHGYALVLRGGKPQFAIRVDSTLNSVSAKENVVGKWTHLAGVLTPDKQLQIYINGKLAGARKATGFITTDPHQAMEIGADEGGAVGDYKSPFGFAGVIDEVRVYHRALSAREIQQHYSATTPPSARGEALVLYFSFDKGDATDESGNNNNGKLEGVKVVRGKYGQGMRFAGYRRARRIMPYLIKHRWSRDVPLIVRGMVLAGETLFIAGPPDVVDEEEACRRLSDPEIQKRLHEQDAALEGERGALLMAVATSDGKTLAQYKLESPPVWDGMAAANGKLYISTMNGQLLCMQAR